MALAYANVTGAAGSENPGGTVAKIFFVSKALATAIPSVDADGVTISGDITFGGTDGFFELDFYPTTSGITSEAQGEPGGKSFKHMLDGFVTGSAKALEIFRAKALNDSLLVIAQEKCGGAYRLLGDDCEGATIETATFTTGKSQEGRKGVELQVVANMAVLPYYEGTITLDSA